MDVQVSYLGLWPSFLWAEYPAAKFWESVSISLFFYFPYPNWESLNQRDWKGKQGDQEGLRSRWFLQR